MEEVQLSRARISRASIERMHIEMRHLILRGNYKPLGRSGQTMIENLRAINPEIYGSMTHPEKVELEGLLYVFQRLPQGIEECRNIKLISREGLENSGFEKIVPLKRRRNCYRIDKEQMYIEMTRGRSDVYDILTHLTFMYNEAEKIGSHALDSRKRTTRTWRMFEQIVRKYKKGHPYDEELALAYLSELLGRTFEETSIGWKLFEESTGDHSLLTICYWLGKLSIEESVQNKDREIVFSPSLQQRLGHHIYGQRWAQRIKSFLVEHGLYNRPIHIISSNMHSVMNVLFASEAIHDNHTISNAEELYKELSMPENSHLRLKVKEHALQNGMHILQDKSGTNIPVQIFDCSALRFESVTSDFNIEIDSSRLSSAVLIVMDYAFGEQAYETMDELLKPFEDGEDRIPIPIVSINIMGKAGILCGEKGDIMIPDAHIFEGSGNNYYFHNLMSPDGLKGADLLVYQGAMITVLGTSLQNKDILNYFLKSSWGAVGLEMEGAHYHKAIQAASKIRKSITPDVQLRYAYYASDNPLISGATLASGSLGMEGVKPTYAITREILRGIFTHVA
jgi:hypothetical protein